MKEKHKKKKEELLIKLSELNSRADMITRLTKADMVEKAQMQKDRDEKEEQRLQLEKRLNETNHQIE